MDSAGAKNPGYTGTKHFNLLLSNNGVVQIYCLFSFLFMGYIVVLRVTAT